MQPSCSDPATEYDVIENVCKLRDGGGEAIHLDEVNKVIFQQEDKFLIYNLCQLF